MYINILRSKMIFYMCFDIALKGRNIVFKKYSRFFMLDFQNLIRIFG